MLTNLELEWNINASIHLLHKDKSCNRWLDKFIRVKVNNKLREEDV